MLKMLEISMITLYGFGRVHPGMIGEAHDLRVQWPLFEMTMIDIGMRGEAAREGRATLVKEARRWFDGLERRLDGREWIACDEFTVADILLATVLRAVPNTDLMQPYPQLKAYCARAMARPAWQRTRRLCAERQGVTVANIR
jgi:glutathione S-transferase